MSENFYTNYHNYANKDLPWYQVCKICDAQEKDPPKVDFKLLHELSQENLEMTIQDLICFLELNDIPMTDAVRKLGICAGELIC